MGKYKKANTKKERILNLMFKDKMENVDEMARIVGCSKQYALQVYHKYNKRNDIYRNIYNKLSHKIIKTYTETPRGIAKFSHSKKVCDIVTTLISHECKNISKSDEYMLKLCALTHDISKVADDIENVNHASLSADLLSAMLYKFNVSSEIRDLAHSVVFVHSDKTTEAISKMSLYQKILLEADILSKATIVFLCNGYDVTKTNEKNKKLLQKRLVDRVTSKKSCITTETGKKLYDVYVNTYKMYIDEL